MNHYLLRLELAKIRRKIEAYQASQNADEKADSHGAVNQTAVSSPDGFRQPKRKKFARKTGASKKPSC
jgi:hypothetical protein